MATKKKSKNSLDWPEVKRIVKLSVEEVEMAKKCGMSPRDVRANYSSTFQEKWKSPTREWIRECYERKYGALTPGKAEAPPVAPPSTLSPPKPTPVCGTVVGKRGAKRIAQQRLALKGWQEHLAKVVRFPFDARVEDLSARCPLRFGEVVRVIALEETDEVDDMYGLFAIVQTDRGSDTLPLCDLCAVDQSSENYQPLDDYAVWFANK